MPKKIRETIANVKDQLFFIRTKLAPRDGRFYQAVTIFEEVVDFSSLVNYRAFPDVYEKDGGEITTQQLEELATGYNLALKNTSLDDFIERLTIETFGIIADKIDKHYTDLDAPDSFSQFIRLAGRSMFKKAAKYLIVKTLNTTTYHLEGDSVLYIETCDDFLSLYFFVKDSINKYIKAHLIG